MEQSSPEWSVLNCRFIENVSPWNWRSDRRPYFNFWVALRGMGSIRVDGRRFAVEPGVVFLFGRGETIRGESDRGVQRMGNFAAHFEAGEDGEAEIREWARRLNGRTFRDCLWLVPALRDLSRDFSLRRDPGERNIGRRMRLLVELLALEPERGEPAGRDRVISGVLERIRRNPAASYSVDEMAAECGLSASGLRRRFREATGHPPNRFLVEERLRAAEMMLLGGNAKIGTIAEKLGYRDVYFFSRQFRRHRGVSPSAFRDGISA